MLIDPPPEVLALAAEWRLAGASATVATAWMYYVMDPLNENTFNPTRESRMDASRKSLELSPKYLENLEGSAPNYIETIERQLRER